MTVCLVDTLFVSSPLNTSMSPLLDRHPECEWSLVIIKILTVMTSIGQSLSLANNVHSAKCMTAWHLWTWPWILVLGGIPNCLSGCWTGDCWPYHAPFIIACPSNEVSHLPPRPESWHGNVNAWYLRNLQAQDLRILGFYDKILQLFAAAVSGWRAPQLSFKISSSVPNSQGQLLLWWILYLGRVEL